MAVHNVFSLTTIRSIKGGVARFLAIMGIVALGCGFYAGLKMCGPDMRAEADQWYDGTNLWDLRLISTLGFSDSDVERVSQIDGVDAVMPSVSVDAMAALGKEQLAVRISTLDVDAAEDSTAYSVNTDSSTTVSSDDEDYLNRLVLVDGRWPQADNECVISADTTVAGVGIGDTISLLYGSDDLGSILQSSDLVVVGTVSSSNYPYTGSFGSTTLGSGNISQYVYVSDSALVDGCPYTELFIKVAGASELTSESDEYYDRVDEVKQNLEDAEEELATARQTDIKEEAQQTLDEQIGAYVSQKEEVESQLADAKATLDASQTQIQEASDELAAGEQSYQEGLSELSDKKQSAYAQLADAQDQIDEQQATLDQSSSTLDASSAQIEEARSSIQTLESSISQAQQTLDSLNTQLDEAKQQCSDLQEEISSIEELKDSASAEQLSELKNLQQQLSSAQSKVEELQSSSSQTQQTKESLSANLASVQQSVDTYDQSRAQLEDAQSALEQARQQLSDQRASVEKQLEDAQAELDATASTLSSSREALESSKASYEQGLADYEDQKSTAESQLSEASQKLDGAQQQIDETDEPDLYMLDRSQSEGASLYRSDTERMDSIARVFPLIFFLVAALVALTTMTRVVDDDRGLIGTFKALGYSTARIAGHYLLYAGLASTLGATLGILILTQVLPEIVMNAYGIIYAVPLYSFPLPIDPVIALSSGGIGVGLTLLATWLAVLASLRETPAALMQPRAPKAGKRILLEKIKPLWRKLSFSWKVSFRNIFRYKRRLAMTVVGIAGCTALLLVGLGLHDSIWDIIDNEFGSILHFDTTIGLDEDSTSDDAANLAASLVNEGIATDASRVSTLNLRASSADYSGTLHLTAVVPMDADEMSDLVSLRTREDQQSISFDENSVVLAEKTADLLGLKVGDTLLLYDQDSIGNATGQAHELTVSGITENYVDNLVYVGSSAWSQSFPDEELSYTSILATTGADDADSRDVIGDELHGLEHVSTVVFQSEAIDRYTTMLSAVNMIVIVLTVSAAALAFIVLYNLTNINVDERIREIASLKVLGFTRREIHAYVFREIVLIALLGDLLGLVAGSWLETFVITTAEVDYVMFGRIIHTSSYLYAFILTMVFTVMALLMMRRKLDRIDMVESLKSVD
jgi:putative ABC transport system permease protein